MQKHRLEIDGLRTFAVIPVVLFHMGFKFIPAGFLGVDVFFVISGFLISGILVKEFESTGTINFLNFYERRIRRILPGFLLVMFVTFIFSWLILLPQEFEAFRRSLLYSLISLSNTYFLGSSNYFSPDTGTLPLLHTWSLAVEEQFYLFFPVVLWLIFKLMKRQLAPYVLATFLVASLIFAQINIQSSPNETFYLIQFRAWELLIGAMGSVYLTKIKVKQRASVALSSIGFVIILTSYFFLDNGFQHPSSATLFPTVGAVLVLTFTKPGSTVFWILSRKSMVFIGLLSYSLYLWHQPVFALVKTVYGSEMSPLGLVPWLVVTLALSFLGWKFVENVFRDRQKRSTKMTLRFAGAGTLTLALLVSIVQMPAASYATYTIGDAHSVTVNQVEARLSPNYGVNKVCSNFLAHQAACTSGSSNGGPTVALWGDSFSMHIVQGLQQSSTKAKFIAQTLITCNPILGIAPKNRANGMAGAAKCNRTNSAFFNYLISAKAKSTIRTVILASHWENITLDGKTTLDAKGVLSKDPNKPRRALQETIGRLKQAGYRVVIVSSPAYVSRDTGACLKTAIVRRGNIANCNFPLSSSLSVGPNSILQGLVTTADKYINLTTLMCPNSLCLASVGNTLMFRDKYHISREGSAYLGKRYDLMGLVLH